MRQLIWDPKCRRFFIFFFLFLHIFTQNMCNTGGVKRQKLSFATQFFIPKSINLKIIFPTRMCNLIKLTATRAANLSLVIVPERVSASLHLYLIHYNCFRNVSLILLIPDFTVSLFQLQQITFTKRQEKLLQTHFSFFFFVF